VPRNYRTLGDVGHLVMEYVTTITLKNYFILLTEFIRSILRDYRFYTLLSLLLIGLKKKLRVVLTYRIYVTNFKILSLTKALHEALYKAL